TSTPVASANPSTSKPVSKEKDLTFPKDSSKFGEVGYRNAQEYIFTATNSLRLRRVNIDDPQSLASYLGMATKEIKDDKKRNEYTASLFALEKTTVMTIDDVHKLFLRVCGMTSQTVATSRELLEMRKRQDESYYEFGSRIELQVKRTGTDDKTPAIISHLFSDASPLARTDLKLWLLLRDVHTRSESTDSHQSSSGYKNKPRSDNLKQKSYSDHGKHDSSLSSTGSKRSPDSSAQKDNVKKPKFQLVCTNCPHLSNHVTKDSNNAISAHPLFTDIETLSDSDLQDDNVDQNLDHINSNNTSSYVKNYLSHCAAIVSKKLKDTPFTDNRISLPLIHRNITFNALLDTGCTHSYIDPKVVQ
ncbi:hypothetical protein BGX26_006802, partial [Mortierella sp. AD094]